MKYLIVLSVIVLSLMPAMAMAAETVNDSGDIVAEPSFSLTTIIAGVATVALIIFGARITSILKEVVDVAQAIKDAAADGRISPDELDEIWNELIDIKNAAIGTEVEQNDTDTGA